MSYAKEHACLNVNYKSIINWKHVQRVNWHCNSMITWVRLLLLGASVESAFESSSCHFQCSLVGPIAPNEATHVNKYTARNASFLRKFIISHAPPLFWESLSALEPIGSNSDCLHSPAFAPLILQLCGQNQHTHEKQWFWNTNNMLMIKARKKRVETSFEILFQHFNTLDLDMTKDLWRPS